VSRISAVRSFQLSSRLLLTAVALAATMLACAGVAHASLTAGDVVVYRVGAGSGALSGTTVPVFLDEYDASGALVETIALPTSSSGANKPLVASGSATSEGLLTLSGDGNYLMATGYDTAVGAAKISESKSATVPRTVARVSAAGEVDTTTALTDFANENNPRSATSSDGTSIWVGGAAGGVRHTTLGSSTSTGLNETDKNVRAVSIFNGQLYASADPTKAGALTIATVGSGLPTTATQTIANLPFSTVPKQPYGYAFLTLGLGSTPDTLYVADNEAGAVVKFGLSEGKWVRDGSVAVSGVTGLTANDASGVVTIFATSGGLEGKGPGSLWKITDTSGLGGTLSGGASEIAKTPANESLRGVAFAPGTTIGSGGPPPPPTPTIVPAETSLPAALGDPTNATLGLTVADSGFEAGELTVTASSSNEAVAPSVSVTGSGASRTLTVTPGAVGHSTITLTVQAPDSGKATTTIDYGVSANEGDASDRYYAGAGNASTAIDVGGGYMVVGDDEGNVLRLYHERSSGEPVKTFDFTKVLPVGTSEADIEASARVGDTLYWIGSLSNKKSGKAAPEHDIVFAATLSGSGAGSELTYLGSYTHLREDIVAWDEANGNPLGLAASTAAGLPSNEADGFNAEGLEFAAGSSEAAYVAFRAPLQPPGKRNDALLIPVTNFASLVTHGNPGAAAATFGSALQWDLGGLGLRELRRNAAGQFLAIAGTSDDSNSTFGLYAWDGNPADQPTLTSTALSSVNEGAWEDVVSVPEPLVDGSTIELLEDNGDSVWYGDGLTSKTGLVSGLQKDLGRLFTVSLPAPAAPGAPHLTSGASPNDTGVFTLAWQASSTAGVTYTLQHENAEGGWSDVATGLTGAEYAFTAGSPEGEGTWTYRAIAVAGTTPSSPSVESEPIKVDETPPNPPSPSADRGPDYAGGGGWYKDSVTVSFTGNGDPPLPDASPGSGVNPTTLPPASTFNTDGPHSVSGSVQDNAANASPSASLTVQVDASAPVVGVACPATANVGQSAVQATISASDAQSGLAEDPSGAVAIDTSKAGAQTVSATAIDNVGHQTTNSCTTLVGHSEVITGTLKHKLVVKAGQSVELASTAKTKAVEVQAGGSLDVEGASTAGIKSDGAAVMRICSAKVSGQVKIVGSTGPVTLGDGSASCQGSAFATGVTLQSNGAGSTVVANTVKAKLTITGNTDGVTVTNNTVTKTLTVTANTGTVIDTPNSAGKTKVQARRLTKVRG
jgi:hypothetical protein